MDFDFSKYQLKSLSFYDMLSDDEIDFSKEHSERREFKKGQVIIREGTYSKGIYIIKKGKVKLHNSSPEGKQSIIYIYRRDEFFGYRPMISNELNPATATAMENVVVTYLAAEHFLMLLRNSSTFALKLLISSTSEFSVWINKITLFSQHPVKERTAMALLILAAVYRNGNEPFSKVMINISRDDLAAFIGTAKETVVRMLRVFKDAGIITSSRSVIKLRRYEVLLEHARFFYRKLPLSAVNFPTKIDHKMAFTPAFYS